MTKIEITLDGGQSITLNYPEELEECDNSKQVSLVFDNGEVYTGLFVEIDEDWYIYLKKDGCGIGLPYDRLLGWFYQNND